MERVNQQALIRHLELSDNDQFDSVAFSPDSRLILSGGSDFAARLWDAGTGALAGLMRHPKLVTSARFADGRRIVTGVDPAGVGVGCYSSQSCSRRPI